MIDPHKKLLQKNSSGVVSLMSSSEVYIIVGYSVPMKHNKVFSSRMNTGNDQCTEVKSLGVRWFQFLSRRNYNKTARYIRFFLNLPIFVKTASKYMKFFFSKKHFFFFIYSSFSNVRGFLSLGQKTSQLKWKKSLPGKIPFDMHFTPLLANLKKHKLFPETQFFHNDSNFEHLEKSYYCSLGKLCSLDNLGNLGNPGNLVNPDTSGNLGNICTLGNLGYLGNFG